jgi:hypothetical protein
MISRHFAEAHENVLLHRQITFEEIRHRRRFNAQHRLGDGGDQLLAPAIAACIGRGTSRRRSRNGSCG